MENKLLQPRKRNVLHFNHSKKTSKINNKNINVFFCSAENTDEGRKCVKEISWRLEKRRLRESGK